MHAVRRNTVSAALQATQIAQAQPPVIMIVGPTAVGKTAAALKLAELINAEIVSADSRLFYRGMDIGTAKPSIEERARIPHHLIDVVDPDETLSLAEFQKRSTQAITDILARDRLPVIVGGTGQYIRAVRFGWTPPPVAPNETLRSELARLASVRGAAWLHERLGFLDPAAAQNVDARNLRRTIRALEVILTTGLPFSKQRGEGEIPYRFITIGLRRTRPDLYARIDSRIDTMLEGGLVEETRKLLQNGYSASLPAFSAIGYSQCAQVIHGDIDLREARLQMQRSSRSLVRRQSNWFKETDPTIIWFEATRPDLIEAMAAAIQQTSTSGNGAAGAMHQT
jgi:tRNA dimethylallyltransferase